MKNLYFKDEVSSRAMYIEASSDSDRLISKIKPMNSSWNPLVDLLPSRQTAIVISILYKSIVVEALKERA